MTTTRADQIGELWDVYDAQKNPTGRTHARGDQLAVGDYHLVTNGLVFNAQGDILLQQRAFDKLSHPGIWTADTGGSVLAGATSRQGLVRELSEELGLVVLPEQLRFITTLSYADWLEDWYALRLPDAPMTFKLQTTEVVAVRWASLAEAMAINTANGFDDNHLFDAAKSLLF